MPTTEEGQVNSLFQGFFYGGNSMSDAQKSLQQSIKEIHDRVNQTATLTDLNGAVLNLAQDNLNKYNAIMAKLNSISAQIAALPH